MTGLMAERLERWPIVGVAGARGVVGGVFLSILADAGLPADCLRAFGTEPGIVGYRDESVPVRVLDEQSAVGLEVLFLATDAAISREIVAGPGRRVPLIIDNSSAFRLDPQVPLVVPEANVRALRGRKGNVVANPNCTTAAAVVVLAPIRDAFGLASVDMASYQAVSGAGRAGLDAFLAERGSEDREQAAGSPFHGRIADSVVPQIDLLSEDGWTGEERKIHAEIRKILELPDLDVAATAVRVPVHTGHSVALHFRTSPDEAKAARSWAEAAASRTGLALHPGRMSIELRPPHRPTSRTCGPCWTRPAGKRTSSAARPRSICTCSSGSRQTS